MSVRPRVLVLGPAELRAAAAALELDVVDDAPDLALVDLREPSSCAAAARLAPAIPRVVVVGDAERPLIAALGLEPSRVATSCDVAAIGPLVAEALPHPPRAATRVALVTGVRGGVGRTMLVANLARRIARRVPVCAVDLTGTGALGWWLDREARPWSEIEALGDELSPDHLVVLASEVREGVRVVGGAPRAPSAAIAVSAVRAARTLEDLVLVDAPLVSEALCDAIAPLADRTLVLAYDDPVSRRVLEAATEDDAWLVVSQTRVERLAGREVFRALPRDEASVASALDRRGAVGGALGRAYDELADLLVLDAS